MAGGGDFRRMSRKDRKAKSYKIRTENRPPAPPKAPPPSYPSVRLSPNLVEIPITARGDMNVPARVWADEELWKQISRDRTLHQLINVSTLPGITGTAQAMPDAHEGYGFPVGGVAAFRARDGIISPGGVGYDINCGVRLLASGIAAVGGTGGPDRSPRRRRVRRVLGGRARPLPAGGADPGPRPRHPLGNGEGEPSPLLGRGSRPRPGGSRPKPFARRSPTRAAPATITASSATTG